MSLEFLEAQVSTNQIGSSGLVFLINKTGEILFHRETDQVGEQVAPSLLEEILLHAGAQQHFQSDYRNDRAMLGARQIHDDLLLVGVLPESELLEESRKLGLTVALITAFTVMLTSVWLYISMRLLLVGPVRQLMDATREIAHGNFTPDLKLSSRDEIGQLAERFKEMGQSLAESREKIQFLAYHDSLTGLPNRLMFQEYLRHMIALARREKNQMAVLFLDLDNFKRVNDTLGHQVGDQLLQRMADRLSSVLREEDFVSKEEPRANSDVLARLGGDEFIILLPKICDSHDAARVAARILRAMQQPFLIDNHELYNGTSIGITLYPDDGARAGDLVKRADVAMYHAKEQGRNNFQFYSESYNLATYEHLSMENKLHRALENNHLELYYQPQVETSTGRIVGFEALLRWNDPELGMLLPDQFIPMAEASGMILPVGEWALREACRQNRAWQMAGLPEIFVSVNVSGIQFIRQDLTMIINKALNETGLAPDLLELEVTETGLMTSQQEVVGKLDTLKRLGLSISLDDFGTGYSSLDRLRQFPIDKLKIDRSFVSNMESDQQDASIINAILSIAMNLGLRTTAEGVETWGQLAQLRAAGCDYIQGFLFSPPVPARDVPQLIRNHQYLTRDRFVNGDSGAIV